MKVLKLWVENDLFKVIEQRVVDQANVIGRIKCLKELGVEELTRKLGKNDQAVENPNNNIKDTIQIKEKLKGKINNSTTDQ